MNLFSQLLVEAEFISPQPGVAGSRIYMPAGWRIRNRIVEKAATLLDSLGFSEFHMPSIIKGSEVEKLDQLTPLSSRYYQVTEKLRLAATHEAVFFPFALDHIVRTENRLPLKLYHLGPAYRESRSSPAPFNLGERFSYLEVFSICKPSDYESLSASLYNWASALPIAILNLPSVQVRRPKFGNLPMSEQTLTVETILPIGRTYCTAMLYRQGDIFTKLFGSGDPRVSELRSLHAAVTDNMFYAYLANCMDSHGFCLYSGFSATDVLISCPANDPLCVQISNQLMNKFKDSGSKVEVFFRNSRKPSKELGMFRRQGIPLLISLDSTSTKANRGLAYSRHQPFEAVEVDLSNIGAFKAMIEVHNASIIERLQASRRDSILEARTIHECRDIVSSGKVARFYMPDQTDAVVTLDAQLPGAEILGYDVQTEFIGTSILDKAVAAPVCYASKRL